MQMNRMQANICLVTVTICWASESILLKNVPENIPSLAVVFITNLLGAVFLLLLFFPRIKKLELSRSFVLNIALLALLNVLYNVFYLNSLRSINVTTGEFSRMMTYVIVPMALLLIRRPVPKRTWVGILFVILGICVAVFPTMGDLDRLGVGYMALSCVIEAFYLVRLNDYVKQVKPTDLIIVLYPLIAVFSGIAWAVSDPGSVFTLQIDAAGWASLAMCSIFVGGIAVVLNIYAQKTAMIQDVVIIYSLQIVFSTIFSATLPSLLMTPEVLTANTIGGCVLVCFGNLVADMELKPFVDKLRGRGKEKAVEAGDGRGGDAS